MAVIYTPSGKSPVTIGGTLATGPFPKYSISRSVSSIGDGGVINNVYNINIRGQVIIDSSIDLTVPGARQSNIHSKMIQKLQLSIDSNDNYGRLEIVPYGGQPNAFDFLDAKLVSVEIPEPSEDTSLTSSFDYNFTFEATVDASNRDVSDILWLSSIEESWDVSLSDDSSAQNTSSIQTGDYHKSYSVTHSVSATGKRSVDSSGNFSNSAWYHAKEWVKTRLVDTPADAIIEDFFGGSDFTEFDPKFFNDTADAIAIDLSGYQFYNHIRIPQSNLTGGTYSVTETWEASLSSASLELDVSIQEDQNRIVQVSVDGSVTGRNTEEYSSKLISRYQSALNYYQILEPNLYNIANFHYSNSYSNTLREIPLSKTIGRNTRNGTISFNFTYDDSPQLIPNTISSGIKVTDNNELRDVRTVAVIPIIAKLTGPEIQNMNTTPERRRSLQFDCVMDRPFRTTKPAEARNLVATYAPQGDNVNVQNFVEDFDYITGAYSLSVEWVY